MCTLTGRLTSAVHQEMRYLLPDTDPKYGFVVALWRCGSGCVVGSLCSVIVHGGWSAYIGDMAAAGWPKIALAASLQACMNLGFTVAFALTTAANVLVLLACAPMFTALIGFVLKGTRLPRHTLLACVIIGVAVAICFLGSIDVRGRNLAGLAIALCVSMAYGLLLTLSEDVNTSMTVPPAFFMAAMVCLLVVGPKLPLARPVGFGHFMLAVSNGAMNAISNQLIARGCSTCPAPEAALISMLETALGPVLVYFIVGEKPSSETIAAGVIIIAVLVSHTIYDARWQQARKGERIQDVEEDREDRELLPASALDGAPHGGETVEQTNGGELR